MHAAWDGASMCRPGEDSLAAAGIPAAHQPYLRRCHPRRRHEFAIKGIGGTGSGIYSACVTRMVPPDADIVVRPLRLPPMPRAWACSCCLGRGLTALVDHPRGAAENEMRAPGVACQPGSACVRLPTQDCGHAGCCLALKSGAQRARSSFPLSVQVAEFTVNEQRADSFNVPQRRGYEQLLRKLLKLRDSGGQGRSGDGSSSSSGSSSGGSDGSAGSADSRGGGRLPPPAVIVLHHYGWWISNVDNEFEPGNYYENNEAQLHTFSNVRGPAPRAAGRGGAGRGRQRWRGAWNAMYAVGPFAHV